MSEFESKTPAQDETIRRAVLVSQALVGSTFLFGALGLYLAITTGVWQSIAFTAWIVLAEVILFSSIPYIRRGRMNLGGWIILGLNTFGTVFAAMLYVSLGYVAAAYGLITSFFVIRYVMPRAVQRAAIVVASVGVILSIAAEIINPAWRQTAQLFLTLSPIITALLGIAFLVVVGYQAWQGSIRSKLITAFLVVTLVSLAIASFVNVRNTSAALTENAQQNLTTAANELASNLDAFIETGRDNIRTEAQNPGLVNYLELPVSQRAGSPEEVNATTLLLALSRRDPVYISSYALLDRKGVALIDTYTPDVGLNKYDRDYFQGPLTSGLPYVSPVEFSQTTGEAALYFGTPVRNSAKEIIGVLRVRYNAAILQEIVANATGLAGEESSAILLDENYLRLADGLDPDEIYTSIVSISPERIAELQADLHLPNSPPEQLIAEIPAFEAGLANLETQSYFDAELHAGEAHAEGELGETVTAVQMETRPWLVVFAQSQGAFLAPVQTQTRAALVLSLIIAGAVVVAAYFVSQLFSGPIVRLTTAATELRAGNLSARTAVESSDELGILADTFNEMAAQLQETLAGLEQRVADRTKALVTSAEVTRRLATILNPRQLASEVVNEVRAAFNYYYAQIYLLDEAGENLVLTGGTGEAGAAMLARGHSIPKGRGLVGRAADVNASVLVADTLNEEDWLRNDLLPETRAEAAVPISIGNQVFGVLDVQHSFVGGLTQEDVTLLESLAGQVAISLQNARSYEQSRKQAELESLVNVIGQRIQRTTSIEDTLQTAIRELGIAIGASRVKVRLGSDSGTVATESVADAVSPVAVAESDNSFPGLEDTLAD